MTTLSSKKDQIPLVLVVTRTKDRPLLLERAILSVHNQTMPDFIHLIINDGGDKKPLLDLVKKHEAVIKGRVRIIHNATSIGMQPAANKAIKSTDSKYVVVHDDDDTWQVEFLDKTTKLLEDSNAMGVIAATDLVVEEIIDGSVKLISQRRLYPELKYINLYKMCYENYAAPISFLYLREVFNKIGYYDETLGGVGDWDFALRFLLHYDIEFLDVGYALAFYHHRPQTEGINANSVFTDTHRKLENLIANKYLRQDIRENKTGVGYILNSLRYIHDYNQALSQESLRQNEKDNQQNEAQQQQLANSLRQLSDRLSQVEELIRQQETGRVYPRFRSLSKRTARKIIGRPK